MNYKVVAEIKGRNYSSISFVVDPKDLGKIVETLGSLRCLDHEYGETEDGYKQLAYESGPISIKIETNVPIYTEQEISDFKEKVELFQEEKKKAEENDAA